MSTKTRSERAHETKILFYSPVEISPAPHTLRDDVQWSCRVIGYERRRNHPRGPVLSLAIVEYRRAAGDAANARWHELPDVVSRMRFADWMHCRGLAPEKMPVNPNKVYGGGGRKFAA